ncbi:MAG: hypothetical protein Q9181_007239 [Wetmoreana brouardii]
MKNILATILIYSSLFFAQASLALPPSKRATTAEVINFDTRKANAVLPALNNVGVEKDLYFQSFVIVNGALLLLGVFPHSGKNYIATATEQQALTGTPAIYPASKGKIFTLNSFYFGCAGNTVASVADVAVQCTISVAGFVANREVVSATYTFSPTVANTVRSGMIQAKLPKGFAGVQNVTVIQDNPVTKVLLLDDIDVVLYS